MKLNIETDVTIMSPNLNKNILKSLEDYYVFDTTIDIKELKKHSKIVFFNTLSLLPKNKLKTLFTYIKENDVKYINITNDMEEVLFTKYLVICKDDNILIEGKTKDVLKEEKLLRRLGFKLPFIVDLSLLLKDYSLIDKVYFKDEELIGELWN